jgi:hypothetical protein
LEFDQISERMISQPEFLLSLHPSLVQLQAVINLEWFRDTATLEQPCPFYRRSQAELSWAKRDAAKDLLSVPAPQAGRA